MRDDGKNFIFEFDLSGFERDDLNVNVSDDSISISAEKKIEKKSEGDGHEGVEMSERSFSYSSDLPPVDGKNADVQFSDGKLKVVVPKK